MARYRFRTDSPCAHVAWVACSAIVWLTWASAQVRDRSPVPAKGTAELLGRVETDGPNPQPMSRVAVRLMGPASFEGLTVTSDDGSFSFGNLPSGRFTVSAAKPAYVESASGTLRSEGLGTTVMVREGERATITVRMARGAVLAGRITDATGEPLSHVSVSTRRRLDFRIVGRWVTTDDQGEYRLYGLPPGEYIIVAEAPPLSAVGRIRHLSVGEVDVLLSALRQRRTPGAKGDGELPRPDTSKQPVAFAPLYFPGVASLQEATSIAVGSGEVRDNLSFAFTPVPTSTVEGRVISPVPIAGTVQVVLQQIGGISSVGNRNVQARADGAFTFTAVAPGAYELIARARADGVPERLSAAPGMSPVPIDADVDYLYGWLPVEARGTDIRGLSVSLGPGGTLEGAVRSDPETVPGRVTDIAIAVSPLTGTSRQPVGGAFSLVRQAPVKADGSFVLRGIAPGKYSLQVKLPSVMTEAGWLPKSAVLSGRDMLDNSVEFTPGLGLAGAAVTISNRYATVSGRLETPSSDFPPDYLIVIFPQASETWRVDSRRVRVVRVGTDGTFGEQRLQPGDYLVGVIAALNPDGVITEHLFRQLQPSAVRVNLLEGESKVVELRVAR